MIKVRKIPALILSVLIIFNSIAVFADNEGSLNVTASGETKVDVSGFSNPNTTTSLQVLRLGDNDTAPYLTPELTEQMLHYIDSVVSSDDGSFSFVNIEMGMVSGKYLFRVNDINESTPQEFVYTYRSPLYVQEVIAKYNLAVKNNDTDELGDIINEEKLALLPDEEYLAEITEKSLYSDLCTVLQGLGEAADRGDFQKKFLQAVMLTYFNKSEDLTELENAVADCSTAAGFAEKTFYKKTYLTTLPDDVADGVISALAEIAKTTAFVSVDEFEKMFFEKTVTAGVKECDWSIVRTIIEDNGERISSDTYDEYVSLKDRDSSKTAVVAKQLTGKTFDSLEAFDDAWLSAIKSAKVQASDKGGSSGGGGGGGGLNWRVPQTETVTTPVAVDSAKGYFDDLGSVSWAESSINALAERGVLNGKSERMFYPNDNITRAEFIKMLIAALGITDASAECDFEDVSKEDWHYAYVATGFKLGIANGVGNGKFEPQQNITRQDLCVLAYNAYKLKNKAESEVAVKEFADSSEIADYAKEAVNKLCSIGIVNGVGENLFKPADNATRAQAAKIINSIADIILRG